MNFHEVAEQLRVKANGLSIERTVIATKPSVTFSVLSFGWALGEAWPVLNAAFLAGTFNTVPALKSCFRSRLVESQIIVDLLDALEQMGFPCWGEQGIQRMADAFQSIGEDQLTKVHKELLHTVRSLKAVNRDTRVTAEAIISRAYHAEEWNNFKTPLRQLVNWNYLNSQPDGGGGYWLSNGRLPTH